MKAVFWVMVLWIAGCGYRPVAGRMAVDVPSRTRFLTFLVQNDTAELALSHVVAEAARSELGRRNLLSASTLGDDDSIRLEFTLRRTSETPASYSPAGTVIEYYGEMYFDYRVYATDISVPVTAVTGERVSFRYDFDPNPQISRQYRFAAIATAVREWIPLMLWQTAAAMRYPKTTTAATVRDLGKPPSAPPTASPIPTIPSGQL